MAAPEDVNPTFLPSFPTAGLSVTLPTGDDDDGDDDDDSGESASFDELQDLPSARPAGKRLLERSRSSKQIAALDVPQDIKDILTLFDSDADGFIDVREVQEAADMIFAAHRSKKVGGIPIDALPKQCRKSMQQVDFDGDGFVSDNEIAAAAQMYHASKKNNKRLFRTVGALALVMLALVGVMGAVMFAIVESTKETRADAGDGVMRTNTVGPLYGTHNA
jgi:hypothetical protein